MKLETTRHVDSRLTLMALSFASVLSVGCLGETGDAQPNPDGEDTVLNSKAAMSSNGFAVNGFAVNGFAVNGFAVNGFAVNGFAVNGFAVNGLSINGLGENGIGANGLAVNGFAVNGLGLNGVLVNGLALNGFAVNGIGIDGLSLNGLYLNGIGLPGGGTDGISLNGLGVNGVGVTRVGLNGLVTNGSIPEKAIKVGNTFGQWVNLSNPQIVELDKVMRFVVGCAIPAGQTVTIIYPSGSSPSGIKTYSGSYGYAPEWRSGALSATNAQILRNCLVTQVNHKLANNEPGVQVGMGLNAQQEARMKDLLGYLVSCALPAGDSATVRDSSGNQNVYYGALGLAPEWKSGALPPSKQGRVTACLAARASATGSSATMSLRGAGVAVNESEQSQFPIHEGAFWGDLFSETASLKVCKANGDVLARVCADPNQGCGFEFVGNCSEVCTNYSTLNGYTNCSKPGESPTTQVINSYLRP